MSSLEFCEDMGLVSEVVTEQKKLFQGSDLVRPLYASELLEATSAIECVTSQSLYGGIEAKVIDNPNEDSLTFLIDKPTVGDMIDAFSSLEGPSKEDILRLYVGEGLANLLILHSFKRPGLSRVEKFGEALSESNNFYTRTMDSKVFDDKQSDAVARTIATDGHEQMARVNAIRLKTGMFIEAQPDPQEARDKVEKTFQSALVDSVLSGKEMYVRTVGLFGVEEQEADSMHVNNAETMVGLAYPMYKKEAKELLKIIK